MGIGVNPLVATVSGEENGEGREGNGRGKEGREGEERGKGMGTEGKEVREGEGRGKKGEVKEGEAGDTPDFLLGLMRMVMEEV